MNETARRALGVAGLMILAASAGAQTAAGPVPIAGGSREAALLQTISVLRTSLNPRLAVAGVVLTMVDGRTRLSSDVADELDRHLGELLFRARVPRSVRLAEAPSHGLPVIHYDRRSAGAAAYWDVANELIERVAQQRAEATGFALAGERS